MKTKIAQSERPRTDLDDMAERMAEVVNSLDGRLPITPGDVDLLMIAEFCWALDVTPSIEFKILDRAASKEEQ